MNQIPQVSEEKKKQVKLLLEDRKYVEAAQTVAFLLMNPGNAGMGEVDAGVAGDAGVSYETPVEFRYGWLFEPLATLNAFTTALRMYRVEEAPLAIRLRRTTSWFDLLFAKLLQNVLAGIGIVFIGYILFADKFVSTAADNAAIFFWAFGIDVTLNSLLQQSNGIAKAT